jgi:hypothetical protein
MRRGIPIIGVARCEVTGAPGPRGRPLADRVVEFVRRHGEVATGSIAASLGNGSPHRAADVERAIADLAVAGVLAGRRRMVPIRHGARMEREVTYWRLAGGGEPCPSS